MKALARIVAALALVGGLCGTVVCAWALLDPSILPQATTADAFAPPSPRWRAAFGLVFSLGLLLFGSGRLRHRELP